MAAGGSGAGRGSSLLGFYPHAEVTRKFGVLREGAPVAGISERAVFVVDKAGKIAFAKVYPIDQLPEIEAVLGALRGLA